MSACLPSMRPLLRLLLHGSIRGSAGNNASPMYGGNSYGTKTQNSRRLRSFGNGEQASVDTKVASSYVSKIPEGTGRSMSQAKTDKRRDEWIELREEC